MITCLSPNGTTTNSSPHLPDRLVIATLEGVVVAERDESGFRVITHALSAFHISSLAFERSRQAIFAGSYDGGVHVSFDRGQTWELTGVSIQERNVFTVAAHTFGSDVDLYVGTEPVGLYRSTDYGETWTELPSIRDVPNAEMWTFPAPPHNAHLKNLVFDERDRNVFYIGVEQGGLFKTVDGGKTWTELEGIVQIDDVVYKDVHRMLIHPDEPDTMFTTGGDGLSVSKDAGNTWRRVLGRTSTIGYPDGLVINPLDPTLMFVSGSRHNPGTWDASQNADAHIARSKDGGVSWEIVGMGLPNPLRGNIEALSLSVSSDGCELYAGTTDGEVYSSVDIGEHFSLILEGLAPISKGGHYRHFVTMGSTAVTDRKRADV